MCLPSIYTSADTRTVDLNNAGSVVRHFTHFSNQVRRLTAKLIEFIDFAKSPIFQKQLAWKSYKSLDHGDSLEDRGLTHDPKGLQNQVRQSIEVIIPGQRGMQRLTEKGDLVSAWLELENRVQRAKANIKISTLRNYFPLSFVNGKNWKQKTNCKDIKKINIFQKELLVKNHNKNKNIKRVLRFNTFLTVPRSWIE